jgi:hypothetical protein
VALCAFKGVLNSNMTKYVSIIGNGESRRGFDMSPLKDFSTVVGCNALHRDYMLEYLVCCDKHMCQEAANTVSKNTNIFTRDRWFKQFQFWPNVKRLPELPYTGDQRKDEPFHWGTGPYAGVLALTFKPKAIFMLGFDLYDRNKKINNMYTGSHGYTYIKRPVDPSYWIYQFDKLMKLSPDVRWIVVNEENWKMPKEWSQHKNVFQESYEGMAKFINKQLTKSK